MIKTGTEDRLPQLPSPAEFNRLFAQHLLPANPFTKTGKTVQSIYNQPIALESMLLDYAGIYNGDGKHFNNASYFHQARISTDWSVIGIPFIVGFQSTDLSNASANQFSYPKIQFDKEAYQRKIQNTLSKQLNATALEKQLQNPFASSKELAEKALQAELKKLTQEYGQGVEEKIKIVGNIDNLLAQDSRSIQQQLLTTDFFQQQAATSQALTELQQHLNLGEAIDTVQYNALKETAKKLTGVQELVKKLEEHKTKWEASGLAAKLKQWDMLKKEQLAAFLRQPGTIASYAKQHLSLNGMQKFFLQVTRLQGGQNAVTSSPLALNHFLNNGLLTAINKGKKDLTFFMGSQPGITSIADNYVSNIEGLKTKAKAFQWANKGSGSGETSLSLMSFSESFDNILGNLSSPDKLRQTIVTTLHKEFTIGSKGKINAEVSRSATDYNGQKAATDNKKGLEQLLGTDDFFKKGAYSVSYADALANADLSYQVKFKKVSNGYSNPGSAFLNQGSSELGFAVKKDFLKRKLQLDIRTDVREYKYAESTDDKWRNVYSVFNARWRLRKGQFLSLRYLPSQMVRIEEGHSNKLSQFNRLSVDANLVRRTRTVSFFNNSSLSYQGNSYKQAGIENNSNTLTIVVNNNILFGNRLVFLNTQYNQALENTNLYYFNSGINADAGTSYTLFKCIQGSTAVSYNSVHDWYKQVGVRQTFAGELNEQFSLQVYIDARESLAIYKPLLFAPLRLEVSGRYLFKK